MDQSRGNHSQGSRSRGNQRRGASGLKLSSIFPSARFIGCDDIVARGCTDDIAQCGRGDVFVARMTDRSDGHDQVAVAIERGVAAVIAERIVPTAGVPLCLVESSDRAFARLAHALAGDPARRMRVIAVAGTSGKTTTAWLTAAVLAEAGLGVGVLSDLGCIDADGTSPEPCDHSRPPVLAQWLARLAAGGATHAVVEVSSRMLAAHALADIGCDSVVVTNIGRAHVDRHGTARGYRRIQSRILDALDPLGCLVTDGDGPLDRLLDRAARTLPEITSLTSGFSAACDLRAHIVERSLHGQTFLMAAGGQMLPVSVATPVKSFVRDALHAAAIGLRYGVPPGIIARGLEAAGGVPQRVERLDRGQDTPVFIDTASSAHALAATLGSLRRLTRGRLVLLAGEDAAARVGGAASRAGGSFRSRVGRWCDECVMVPRTILDERCGAESLTAYARIDRLLSRLGERDCVLILDGWAAAGRGPGGSAVAGSSLAALVDGWLQLAHRPTHGVIGGPRWAA